jgi:hypothetical protein
MESNILDELLNKIKCLESQNNSLHEEMESIKKKIEVQPKEEINIENGIYKNKIFKNE